MRSLSVAFLLVIMLTTGTTIIEIAIAHTPISGDFDAAELKPEVMEITRVAPPTVIRPDIMPAKAPILVIFFENKPQMYGPMKQPETIPQEKDIRLTMIGIFCVAKIKEQATNARQRIRVRDICFFAGISFLLTAGIMSTATAEAEVKTTASRVDIDAESNKIIMIAKRIMPSVPFPRTSISTAGIMASIPPSGSVPLSIKRDVLPIKYAPHPITIQNLVEMMIPWIS